MARSAIGARPPRYYFLRIPLRVAASIIILFGGLIIAIVYAAFFASSFSTFQKWIEKEKGMIDKSKLHYQGFF
jgi:hypothetical protein